MGKPLLIEGPPGVGKTSLVTALSNASGHRLTRSTSRTYSEYVVDSICAKVPSVAPFVLFCTYTVRIKRMNGDGNVTLLVAAGGCSIETSCYS